MLYNYNNNTNNVYNHNNKKPVTWAKKHFVSRTGTCVRIVIFRVLDFFQIQSILHIR